MSTSQVMVLTGAASGIGRHLTGVLAAAGHRLLATDVNHAGLVAVAQSDAWPRERVELRALDVRDAVDWGRALDEALARWGGLDVLFNIAGYLRAGFAHELSPEEVDRHFDINAKGLIYGTQAAAARMVRRKSGHIVNIASLAGLAPVSGISLYSASKFAARGFSLAVDQELRPLGVAVTVVCPDAVRTPMLDQQMDFPEAALTFSGGAPLELADIERLILDRVLPHRPMEAVLPRGRGWLAKMTSAFPEMTRKLLPKLQKKGLARQTAARVRRDAQRQTEKPPIANP